MGHVESEYTEEAPLRVRALKDTGSSLKEESSPESDQENMNTYNLAPKMTAGLPYLSEIKVVNAMSRTNS